MQKPKLHLEEIIWEITGECKNGCEYCGSKGVRNQLTDPARAIEIAKSICAAEYEGLSVTISGGDPLLIPTGTHRIITEMFKDRIIIPKIIVNPKSLKESDLETLSYYKTIGLSINDEKEISIIHSMPYYNGLCKLPITVITNFDNFNVALFDDIKDIVLDLKNAAWQIQYTMYQDPDAKEALYSDSMASGRNRKLLESKLSEIQDKVLLADNMNPGECSAGSRSLGILYDGTVIPCLSFRSWMNEDMINRTTQGNLLDNEELDAIWEENFQGYRFQCFECCKDICNNRVINIDKPTAFKQFPEFPHTPTELEKYPNNPFHRDMVIVYGVGTYPTTNIEWSE